MPHKDIVVNGLKIASVTGITGLLRIPDTKRPDLSFLEAWRGNMGHKRCDAILEASKKVGTSVHNSIEHYLRTGEIEETNREFVISFIEWKEKVGFDPVEVEPSEPLIGCTDLGRHKDGESCESCFQGSFDAIGYIGGELVICDWKTSSKMSITNGLQLSAYAHLSNTRRPLSEPRINTGYIVRLDKKTKKYHDLKYENLRDYFQVFQGLIPAYYYVHQTGRWA